MCNRNINIFIALIAFIVFCGASFWRAQSVSPSGLSSGAGRVVISAPILLVLYGGDRYLAGNVEVMRLAATGVRDGQEDADFLIRAQAVVAQLNACHEDNYFLANGLLTWGGAVAEGNKVLRSAVNCRSWDYVPPFFYGVNLAFFQRDIEGARRLIELASTRSKENGPALRKLAVMLEASKFSDERLALQYLISQRDSAGDSSLRDMLHKRVVRLEGLIKLRDAQRLYEKHGGRLERLDQLVEKGVIKAIPADPLKLGYEVREGRVHLRTMKIAGMESFP